MTRLFSILGLLLWPATAWSAETASYSSAALQMIWALLIVLGIILLLYAIVKKRFGIAGSAPGSIQVKEIRYLMPKKGLAIVEVRGQELLIGIGVNRLELLTTLPPEENKKNFDEVLEKTESLKVSSTPDGKEQKS